MIKFSLKCENDHQFESWFQSDSTFEKLQSAGMVTCAVCGDAKISKTLMAPQIAPARKKGSAPAKLSAPQNDTENAIAKIKKDVESNSEYVGLNFSAEARKMHSGDAPERSIYGEAKIEEAKSLIEDGIPVAPLPFVPKRNSN